MKNTLRLLYHRYLGTFRSQMRFPTYSADMQKHLRWCHDPVRHATMALALERIRIDQIPGALAEIGVHRGYSSALLHAQMPDRLLYLFDTFGGFPDKSDSRFTDTSVDLVKRRLGNLDNIEFRVGIFPETTCGLDGPFSFVLFDADKYDVAMQALLFFYVRLSRGGYFFFHDFNSPESDHAVERAVRTFLRDKIEMAVEIPDAAGSAFFRKLS